MASSARIDELRKKFDENPRRYFAPLANEYRKLGDLEQAIFICQEYLPQQPGHMSGHIVYGQALFELSRFDESRAVFETALSLDPENLIALRHLGDIARQAGDLRGARGWYQRVLEADPRNEEIAQIMMTLLATPDDSMPAVSPGPASDVLTTVPVDGARVPTPLSSVVIEKSQDAVDLGAAPELSSLREAAGESAPVAPIAPASPADAPSTSTWGAPAVDEHELLDLEDFSVGGIALSSLGAPPPEIEPVGPPPIPEAAGLETIDEIELERASVEAITPTTAAPEASSATHVERGAADESFEADPFAITATPGSSQPPVEASPIELATDLDLGLRPDGVTSTTFSESQGERIADLETYGETLKGADAADFSATLEIDTFFSGMSRETGPLGEPAVGASAPDHVETRTPTPQFVEAIPAFSTNLPPSVEEITTPSVEAAGPPPIESVLPLDEPPPIPDLDSFDLPSLGMTSTELPVFGRPFTPPPAADTALPAFETPSVEPEPTVSEVPEVLEVFEATEELEAPEASAAPEVFETFEVFEAPEIPEAGAAPAVEPVQPLSTWTPEPQPAVPSEEFVTETMAELYLEQGHPEAAIDIYRRLIAQRPDDDQLASRLRGVEAALNGETLIAAEEPAPADRPLGPTIREFLAGLLRFVPTSAAPDIVATPDVEVPEAAVAAPSVPTPVYDFEAIEARRAPTPPYDLDAIAARSVPTPIYGLPEVEAAPPVVEQSIVEQSIVDEPIEESPIVEQQSEPVLGLPDTLEESEPVLDLPEVDAPALSSIDDMELATPASAHVTPAYSAPVEPSAEQSTSVRPTPARSTPKRSTPVSPFAAVAGIPTPVKPTLVRATPGASETVSGSIDALFSGASASSADSDAAAALSQAFLPETPEPAELPGKPAHAASNELSLDHVFKSTPPRPKEGESDVFSFDQFFADDLAQGAPKSGAEPPAAPGNSTSGGDAGDDIAQFNNWLNSLKKT